MLDGAKFKSCYHKCLKHFFGYLKFSSVTNMLLELGLPSFATIIHNYSGHFSLSLGRLLVTIYLWSFLFQIHSLVFTSYCALHFCHVSACFYVSCLSVMLFSLSVFYVLFVFLCAFCCFVCSSCNRFFMFAMGLAAWNKTDKWMNEWILMQHTCMLDY